MCRKRQLTSRQPQQADAILAHTIAGVPWRPRRDYCVCPLRWIASYSSHVAHCNRRVDGAEVLQPMRELSARRRRGEGRQRIGDALTERRAAQCLPEALGPGTLHRGQTLAVLAPAVAEATSKGGRAGHAQHNHTAARQSDTEQGEGLALATAPQLCCRKSRPCIAFRAFAKEVNAQWRRGLVLTPRLLEHGGGGVDGGMPLDRALQSCRWPLRHLVVAAFSTGHRAASPGRA